jgi:hypothetical protein
MKPPNDGWMKREIGRAKPRQTWCFAMRHSVSMPARKNASGPHLEKKPGETESSWIRKRKDVLAAGGRRASEKRRMPDTDDRARFKNGGRPVYLDQHDHGGRGGNWCHRVYHNANRATIRVGAHCMRVHDLDHRQKRQQGQTKKSGRTKSTRLRAIPSEMCR